VSNRFKSLTASLLALALLVLAPLASAVEPAVDKAIRAAFKQVNPKLMIEAIGASEMPGLYAVEFEGGELAYATADGKFFLLGNLFGVDGERGLVNYTERHRSAAEGKRAVKRKEELDRLDPATTIAFKPKGETRAVIHVFTDIDCFYCQKFHADINRYNQLGIEVRYLAYPRAGIPSESYNKLATAWCAKDRQMALTELKRRKPVPTMVCRDNPVADHFAMGDRFGVNGTPALIMPDGRLVPGYLPPAELAKELGIAPQ
jgi:thiol:disulfide interchange protein DsbC